MRWLAVLSTHLDLDRIRAARRVIDPIFLNTPLYQCGSLEHRLGYTDWSYLPIASSPATIRICATSRGAITVAGAGGTQEQDLRDRGMMKIAVASCTKISDVPKQPVWAEIHKEKPDVLLLVGDNVYLRYDNHSDPAKLEPGLGRRYAEQFAQPQFKALISSLKDRGAPVIAIYDDHDFLGNNRYGGDVSPALRTAARAAFVNAFQPKQTGKAVYSVARLGLVDIVTLDGRFYRKAPGPLQGSRPDAFLGARQWKWLEKKLAQPTEAKYTIIMSGSTFHKFGDESWEQYPAAFNRLHGLIKGRSGTFVLSGDIHKNTVYDDDGVMEIVTSGAARLGITNRGPRKNYGILTFDDEHMQVDLRSLQVHGRLKFTVPLSAWALP
ncbi:MAG TPA: alkaline phosphatase D family protein [Kineosporiaceae bacterium]|nr:alkaline phosphatase D family protein [Kineosporiaceae bacterium]